MNGRRVLLCLPALVYWIALIYWAAVVSCYTDVDDNLNFNDIVKNRTTLKYYLYCFMNKGPCDDRAVHFKIHLKEAITNKCKFCDETQKHDGHVFMRAIEKQFPEETKVYKTMYDNDGTHFQPLEVELDKF